ncbi:MAG: hypothetical protein ACTHLJ_09155 [Angustibacter sp.]
MRNRARILVALSVALAALLALATPSSATATGTFRIHGALVTTMDPAASPNPLNPLIVASPTHPSTVSGLGRVSLHQRQVVQPDPASPPFGHQTYFGTIVSDPTEPVYLQSASGDRLYFTFAATYESFAADTGEAPWPIAFSGTMTFTGGTGRFVGASGSATFTGRYCFLRNGGVYSFDGTVALPQRG